MKRQTAVVWWQRTGWPATTRCSISTEKWIAWMSKQVVVASLRYIRIDARLVTHSAAGAETNLLAWTQSAQGSRAGGATATAAAAVGFKAQGVKPCASMAKQASERANGRTDVHCKRRNERESSSNNNTQVWLLDCTRIKLLSFPTMLSFICLTTSC